MKNKLEFKGIYNIEVKSGDELVKNISQQNMMFPLFYYNLLNGISSENKKLIPIIDNSQNRNLLSDSNFYNKLFSEPEHFNRILTESKVYPENFYRYIIDDKTDMTILGFILIDSSKSSGFEPKEILSVLKLEEALTKTENQFISLDYSINHQEHIEDGYFEYEPMKNITVPIYYANRLSFIQSELEDDIRYESNKQDYERYVRISCPRDERLQDGKIETWCKIYYIIEDNTPFSVRSFNALSKIRDSSNNIEIVIGNLTPDVNISFTEDDIGKVFQVLDITVYTDFIWTKEQIQSIGT